MGGCAMGWLRDGVVARWGRCDVVWYVNCRGIHQPERASVRFELPGTLPRLPQFQPGASARAADGWLRDGVVARWCGCAVVWYVNCRGNYQPERASVRFELAGTLPRLPQFKPGASAHTADDVVGRWCGCDKIE